VLTKTHVILLQLFYKGPEDHILVQAFTVLDDQRHVENGKGELRLSHEGIFSSDADSFIVIRNSVVDPITGDIGVKILERHTGCRVFPPTCLGLTLHKPSPDDVLPITFDRHPVLIKRDATHDDPGILGNWHGFDGFDTSDDGYARGWFKYTHRRSKTECLNAAKFTIDATQDRCVAVLSQFSSAEWDAIMYPILHGKDNVVLDSVRGRLSYVDNKDSGGQAIVVLDLE